MNVTFTPAANVLGFLPGGWLSIVLTLVVAFVVTRLLGRSLLSRAESSLLFLILASLVFYTGFEWNSSGWMGLVRFVYIVSVILAIILLVVDRFSGTTDRLWKTGRGAGTIALVASILLASNLQTGSWGFQASGLGALSMPSLGLFDGDAKLRNALQQQSDEAIELATNELREEFTAQLEGAKIDATSYETECKSIPNVCAVIDAHTEDIDELKAEDAKLWKAIKDIKDKSESVVALPEEVESVDAADSLAKSLAPMGWRNGEVVTGDKIDWSKNRYDAGNQAFVEQSINTPAKYAAHLNGPSASDKAAKKLVLDNTPKELHATFLKGESVIPVQFTEDSCVNGNTGFDGEKVVRFDKICHEAGDIWWVPVGPDGTVYWAAAVRADCGNPGVYVAPFPRAKPAPAVCPRGSDRAGKPINQGCYSPPTERRTTPPATSAPPNNPAPPATSPPETTTPPATSPPVVTTPPATSPPLEEKDESKDPVNNGNAGNGGGQNEDSGPGETTTPTQPPSTPRPTPAPPTAEPTSAEPSTSEPTSTQVPAPSPEPSAPVTSDPAEGCSPAPGRTCP